MTDDAVLALDAGQSGVRARAIEPGAPRRQVELDAVRTNMPVLPQLAQRAAQAVTALWPDATPGNLGLAVGSTGLATDETAAALLAAVRGTNMTGTSAGDAGSATVRRVALAHDAITCYLGALGDRDGVMVAAGTGVVTLSAGPKGVARVDGWGHVLGDDGSGFWIGREGLRAVMRAYDGRGPATALTPHMQADFPHLDDAYLTVQRDPDWVRHIASFAKTIAELASHDAVCDHIIREAADRLATAALVALNRSGELMADPTPTVAALGRCFDGALLRATFETRLREHLADPGSLEGPHTARGGLTQTQPRFAPALGDALDGAAALFDLAPSNPLYTQVRWAD